ncbi:MAG: hypothetical protein U9N79_06890 [Actinomycetota bacterium]|nr:hypothetical protein [Actinomycetota bacterium]
MTDDLTVDQALEKIIALSASINALEPDNPQRAALERQRDELREDIQSAADASRSVPGLLNELGTLRQRLARIDDRPINEGWAEKARNRWVRWVNDPGAYSNRINEMLDTKDADERAAIVARIAEIEDVLEKSRPVEE